MKVISSSDDRTDSNQDESFSSIFVPTVASTPKSSSNQSQSDSRMNNGSEPKSAPMQIEEDVNTEVDAATKRSSKSKGSAPMEVEQNESANSAQPKKRLSQTKLSLYFPTKKSTVKRKATEVERPATPDFVQAKRTKQANNLPLIASDTEGSSNDELVVAQKNQESDISPEIVVSLQKNPETENIADVEAAPVNNIIQDVLPHSPAGIIVEVEEPVDEEINVEVQTVPAIVNDPIIPYEAEDIEETQCHKALKRKNTTSTQGSKRFKRIVIDSSDSEDESVETDTEVSQSSYIFREVDSGLSTSSFLFNSQISNDFRMIYKDMSKEELKNYASAKAKYEKLMKEHKITINKLGLKNDFIANFFPDPFFMLKTVKENIRVNNVIGNSAKTSKAKTKKEEVMKLAAKSEIEISGKEVEVFHGQLDLKIGDETISLGEKEKMKLKQATRVENSTDEIVIFILKN